MLQLAPLIPTFLQGLLEHIGEMNDAANATPHEWRRVEVIGRPLNSAVTADRWLFSLDIANITGGTIDSTWTDADYTACETDIGQLITQLVASTSAWAEFRETRWYRKAFNPMTNPKPFAISGPPERVFPHPAPGTFSTGLASQTALSVTEKTAYPRHWGRSYVFGLAAGLLGSDYHFPNATCDNFAGAFANTYASLMSKEFFPVVPVTQVQTGPVGTPSTPTRGLLTVSEIQVDNVPDVIRRRRPSVTTYRAVQPLP